MAKRPPPTEPRIEATECRAIEHNGEFGIDIFEVRCPRCDEAVRVAGGDDSMCRCGYRWRVEVRAVGELPEKP